MVFGTAILRYKVRHYKPPMKPANPKTPPETNEVISRAIFNVVNEHGPISFEETWERISTAGLRGLEKRSQFRTFIKWMTENHKIKLHINHANPLKQYLYTTWFTKSTPMMNYSPKRPKSP